MSRPKVKLENYSEVYDFYESYNSNKLLAQVGHLAMNLVFHPKILFLDDSDKKIEEHLNKESGRLFIAANHQSIKDIPVIAAMARSSKPLRSLQNNTFILSRDSLFQSPILRRGVDIMGAIPTFRSSITYANFEKVPADKIALQEAATDRLITTAQNLIVLGGQNMAIFPEGTRNKTDPYRVQKIKSGIGKIACGVNSEVDLAIIPIGIWYGDNKNHSLAPILVIGSPIDSRTSDPSEVTAELKPAIQHVLDIAISES